MRRCRFRVVVVATSILIAIAVVVTLTLVGGPASVRPTAPRSVHATPGNGFVTVYWSRPEHDDGYAITRYVVSSHPATATCTTFSKGTSCTLWELKNGTTYEFTIAAENKKGRGPSSRFSNAVTPLSTLKVLPSCNEAGIYPTQKVTHEVVSVVTRYYAVRHLAPITIFQNTETVRSVHEDAVGTNWCRYPGGGTSASVGYVPLAAEAAVEVLVEHMPYPVTYFSSNFVTLAKLPGSGWTVVGEGTSP